METIERHIYEEGNQSCSAHGGDIARIARNARGLGIAGIILGGAAFASQLWRGGNWNAGGGASPANININGGGGCCAPSAFDVYSKGCEDVVALTNAFWQQKVNTMQDLIALRNTDVAEKFALYNSQVTADFGLYKSNRDALDVVNNRLNAELFGLYKYTRDKDDETAKELSDLRAQVAINSAVRPYQDKLIQCEIDNVYKSLINYVDRRTCKMLEGVVTLPTTPTVTGLTSYCCCSNQAAAAAG